jgi:hypothetical protein
MKLRFIKDWGPYKAGSYKVTDMETTRKFLVEVHQVAEVVPDLPPPTSFDPPNTTPNSTSLTIRWKNPPEPERNPELPSVEPGGIIQGVTTGQKYLRSPKRDKMLRGPRKAKAETPPPEAGENE